jgi:beta-xylosidase
MRRFWQIAVAIVALFSVARVEAKVAPEVYYINGKFHMYYTAEKRICVATSDSPTGPEGCITSFTPTTTTRRYTLVACTSHECPSRGRR